MVIRVPSESLNNVLESFKPSFSEHSILDLPGVHEATAPFRTGQNIFMLARTERGLQTLVQNIHQEWYVVSGCTLGDAKNNSPQLHYPFRFSAGLWSTDIEIDQAPHIVGGIHPESKKTYCYMGYARLRKPDGEIFRRFSGFDPEHSDFIGTFSESMRIVPRMYKDGFVVIEREGCRFYIHGEPTLKDLKALCEEGDNLKELSGKERIDYGKRNHVELPANVRFHIDQSFGLMSDSIILIGRAFTPNRERCAPVSCVYTLGSSSIEYFTPLAHPGQYRGEKLRSAGLFMELNDGHNNSKLQLFLSTEVGLECLQYDHPMVRTIVTGRP